jgi:hypothetical protein
MLVPQLTRPHPSSMLSNQIKWQDITYPPWICFPKQLLSAWSKKPESRFVQRVNTHEGCWYHSWQDHDPSLMLSNQIKWQDFIPPLISVNTREGCWYYSRHDHDTSSFIQINDIKSDSCLNSFRRIIMHEATQ